LSGRSLRLGIGVLASVGAGLAGYLLYIRHTGGALSCTTGGCETVQSSRYAEVFGIPVAALGLAGYVAILLTSWSRSELARAGQAAVALAALAFSSYLVFVQLHLIGAVCEWCLVSDAVTAVVAVLVLLRLRTAGERRNVPRSDVGISR
jgi:uncharacterized membrane protein